MQKLLNSINSPDDLRKLNKTQLPQLAQELREFIITIVATKEGHLGASLGVVELSIALHYCYNTPIDNIVWDVGHQAYPHKILTGRKAVFDTNRQLNGISGFPKRSESKYDAFGTGHSSTSISAVLGMALAAKIKHEHNQQHIAVIGDASIASGMAFEALNHAGVAQANLTVILNDNAIGIDPSVGALKNYLTKAKKGIFNRQPNIIEALNFEYIGPIDGHNIDEVILHLEQLKKITGPKLLHIVTTKGKGLKKAEEDQVRYHAPGKFDAKTGELAPKIATPSAPKFPEVLGTSLIELASKNKKIITLTPAMPTGSGLNKLMQQFPERSFDVGIAEQHAVTLAAGMATQGLIPFCVIYSTFLQRAYDQVIHDVALQNLPVVFCIDRAGLVGHDGATHHGVFDMAYLRCIPNLIIAVPADEVAFRNLLYTASLGMQHPIAIRYPRGKGIHLDWKQPFKKVSIGVGKQLSKGNKLAILSIGKMTQFARKAIARSTHEVAHFDMGFVKPLDTKLLTQVFNSYSKIITIEDGVITGGFGSAVLEEAQAQNYKGTIKLMGVPDQFIDHGTTEELYQICNLDVDAIIQEIHRSLN
ncbi:1-deoxy-D-xylulose-5-phosphate synthase [Aquimarina agarilytica]|uniref:1-deoxy-D-xylulose-5-phosphate synthase n=1 Tax=Aquimarina agarilytica TaxID=1087449 RepID=UPI000287B11D|nr:1-deoxy-D-xylulose-5-phosphate synthase [Aquimarina agarilytica]